MTNSRMTQILELLQTTLGAINGTGDYRYTLTGRVIIGTATQAGRVTPPAAYVAAGTAKLQRGPELPGWTARNVITIEAFVPAAADSEARAKASQDLADDIVRALQGAEASLGNLVTDYEVDLATYDGGEIGVPNSVAAYLELSTYRLLEATGGA